MNKKDTGDERARRYVNAKKGKWKIRYSETIPAYPVAITRLGFDIIHLVFGSMRNIATINDFVEYLNKKTKNERY